MRFFSRARVKKFTLSSIFFHVPGHDGPDGHGRGAKKTHDAFFRAAAEKREGAKTAHE